MPDRDCGPHCPFLNRSDTRCSEYFSLDHLQHAFEVCFGDYKSCPVYGELLGERQARRSAAAAAGHANRFAGWNLPPDHTTATTVTPPHATPRLVQVSVSPRLAQLARGVAGRLAHHHAQHAAAGAVVPPPPGF